MKRWSSSESFPVFHEEGDLPQERVHTPLSALTPHLKRLGDISHVYWSEVKAKSLPLYLSKPGFRVSGGLLNQPILQFLSYKTNLSY